MAVGGAVSYAALDAEKYIEQWQRVGGGVKRDAEVGIGVGRVVAPWVGVYYVGAPYCGVQPCLNGGDRRIDIVQAVAEIGSYVDVGLGQLEGFFDFNFFEAFDDVVFLDIVVAIDI